MKGSFEPKLTREITIIHDTICVIFKVYIRSSVEKLKDIKATSSLISLESRSIDGTHVDL